MRFFLYAAGLAVWLIGGAAAAGAADIDMLRTQAPQTARASQQLMTTMAQAGTRQLAAGARGTIIFSDDAGRSWRQASVPTAVMLTGMHFPTPLQGWAVGHDGVILHTQDGGATWTLQFDGDQGNQQMHAAAQRAVQQRQAALDALSDATDEAAREAAETALMFAEDSLVGVEQALSFGPSRALLNVWFADAQTGYAVGAFGMAFVTQDGGRNWTLFSPAVPNPEELHLYAVAPAGEQGLLLAGERGSLFLSQDAGRSWARLPDLADGGVYGLLPVAASGSQAARVLAYGFGGVVQASDDGGRHWQPVVMDGTQALYGGASAAGQVVLVGQGGVMQWSQDGGRHFQRIPSADGRLLTHALRAADGWLLAGWGGVSARTDAQLAPQLQSETQHDAR